MPNSLSELHTLHAWEDNQITERCTQGEYAGKVLQFKLVDKDGAINLSNCLVQYAVTRPDKTEDLLDCTVDNGIVKCNLTYSVTSVVGLVHGEVRVIGSNDSGIIKFYGVNLRVYKGVSDEAAEQSDEFTALIAALQKVVALTPEEGEETYVAKLDNEIKKNGLNPVASGLIYDIVTPILTKLNEHDVALANGMRYVVVTNTSVDDCTQSNTIYNVYVNSGVVTSDRALVLCVSNPSKLVQYAFTRSDFIIFRNSINGEWGEWDYIPNHSKMDSEIRLAIIKNEKGIETDKALNVHNEQVDTYMGNLDYNQNDYTTTNLPNVLSSRADVPNTVTASIPSGGINIAIKDTLTGIEWIESVSTTSHKLKNLIPNRVYFYNVLNSTGNVLDSGVCKTTGQIRMIDGGGNTFNIRDLGGWKCFDGNSECGTLKYGVIYRGARLNGATGNNPTVSLSNNQIAYFKDVLGIRDEIDLRGDTDTAQIKDTALGIGVDYTRINIKYYQYSLHDEQYPDNTAKYAALIKRIAKDIQEGKPIYLHCASGADRTGQVCALIEAICGVRQTDIDRDYELTWFAFETGGSQMNTRRRNYASSNGGGDWNKFINGSHIAGVEDIDGLAELDGTSFTDKVIRYLLRAGVTIDEINAIRFGLINGHPAKLSNPYGTVRVSRNLTNIHLDNSITEIEMYQPFEAGVIVDNMYGITQFKVSVGGIDITSQCYSHGHISIPHVTDDVFISGAAIKSSSGEISPEDIADAVSDYLDEHGAGNIVYEALDYTLSGDNSIVPSLFIKSKGSNYALVYVDSNDVEHELFDFANLPASKGDKGDKGDTGAPGQNGADWVPTAAEKTAIANEAAGMVSVPTKTSQLTNDSGFLTSHQSLANYYNKTEVNSLLDGKANASHTHSQYLTSADIANKADKSDIPDVSGKADKATTLAGYGINNAYTKTQTDTLLNAKERTANKVTAVNSSVTDTQYPSAKAVYNAIQTAIGGVENGSY